MRLAREIGFLAAILFSAGVIAASDVISSSPATDPRFDLSKYGQELSASTQDRSVKYVALGSDFDHDSKVYTMAFRTKTDALMRKEECSLCTTEKYLNIAAAHLWNEKFCTDDLLELMEKHSLLRVRGRLDNINGEEQFLSICEPSSIEQKNKLADHSKPIGKWDDFGSILTIESEGAKFYFSRVNIDGSRGKYELELRRGDYYKIGDRFGAYYRVTNEGLRIYDEAGYIRTAPKLP